MCIFFFKKYRVYLDYQLTLRMSATNLCTICARPSINVQKVSASGCQCVPVAVSGWGTGVTGARVQMYVVAILQCVIDVRIYFMHVFVMYL